MGTRRLFVPVFALLSGIAWLALLLWEQSPYGRYLDHGKWTDIGLAGAICRALPAGDVLLPALIYAGGWMLMIAAMMLPTSLPLFRRFDRLAQARPDRGWLVALLIAGYLLAWAGFGVASRGVAFSGCWPWAFGSPGLPATDSRPEPAGLPPD